MIKQVSAVDLSEKNAIDEKKFDKLTSDLQKSFSSVKEKELDQILDEAIEFARKNENSFR